MSIASAMGKNYSPEVISSARIQMFSTTDQNFRLLINAAGSNACIRIISSNDNNFWILIITPPATIFGLR